MSEFEALGPGLNAGAFIAGAINEGLGVTEARDLMRSYGLSMSNQTFSNLWADIRGAIGERDELAGLDYNRIPDPATFQQWAAGAEGDYITFVQAEVRIPGTDELQPRYYTHRTADPHTPQDAVDAASEFFIDNQDTAIGYGGGTFMGAFVTSVARAR